MKRTFAVTSAVAVESTAVSAIVIFVNLFRYLYSYLVDLCGGSVPSCVQSKDAEREMMSARLLFSPDLVENLPSLVTAVRSRTWLDNADRWSASLEERLVTLD